MGDQRERFSEELNALRELRDEFRVQMELGRAEARKRWEELEDDWHHLESKLKLMRNESKGELEDIGDTVRVLLRQIRDGYRHLRSLL
jgi:BMFP domain-containing protein YqiC